MLNWLVATVHLFAQGAGPGAVIERSRDRPLLMALSLARSVAWLLVAAVLVIAPAQPTRASEPIRVLFVGNSLVYYGNLPGVFDALAAANGHATRSTMIASGGETLAGHLEGGQVAEVLASGHFDYVVLQERGGDLVSGFGPDARDAAHEAFAALVAMTREDGATPVLFGTYQPHEHSSARLVEAEAALAAQHDVAHVAVSEQLRAAVATRPDVEWYAEDSMHPGPDHALLTSALLYRTVFGDEPRSAPLVIDTPPVRPGHPRHQHTYSAERVRQVLAATSAAGP